MMENIGNRRILVVDDDPSFRELLTAFLDDRGYEVESSADGEEALELLRSETADLVLLDLELPGISGLDVLRAIESEKIDTKVITISGHEAAA
ncbi:MAG: response regulator, partial [Deltaproteobacteria bacterium]|nr:response regulator [Deltaproteobacteria bacterium]